MGNRGFPLSTIAFYGLDNRRASKVVASILRTSIEEEPELRKWFTEVSDARTDTAILADIVAYLRENEVQSVTMLDRVFGCPHEEGIDYPLGEICPKCPYWAGRDRWAGGS